MFLCEHIYFFNIWFYAGYKIFKGVYHVLIISNYVLGGLGEGSFTHLQTKNTYRIVLLRMNRTKRTQSNNWQSSHFFFFYFLQESGGFALA